MSPHILTTPEAVRAAVAEAFTEELRPELTRMIRQAILPPYLTKRKLRELTGWSDRQVEYKKSKREIPFVRRGRLVLFPTDEILAYLEAGRVPAKNSIRP